MISRARQFAMLAHGEQKYGDNLPYIFHLDQVYKVLRDFEINDVSILTAAYLHDTVEDTNVNLDFLYQTFTGEVVELVDLVTNQPGQNRKEKHLLTYPRIKQNEKACILKLADRIANVKHSSFNKQPILQMYRKEHKDFQDALYYFEFPYQNMWMYLDQLIKYPIK